MFLINKRALVFLSVFVVVVVVVEFIYNCRTWRFSIVVAVRDLTNLIDAMCLKLSSVSIGFNCFVTFKFRLFFILAIYNNVNVSNWDSQWYTCTRSRETWHFRYKKKKCFDAQFTFPLNTTHTHKQQQWQQRETKKRAQIKWKTRSTRP